MNRFLRRALGAILFVFASQATADIPMVANTLLVRPSLTVPTLPAHVPQTFQGVSTVSMPSGVDGARALDIKTQTDISAFGVPCEVDVQLQPTLDAMIALTVFAPCKPHSAVHVSHGGLTYHTELSLTGHTALIIPAMQREAEVFVAVDENIFERKIEIAEIRHFARVALSAVEGSGPELLASALSKQMEIYQMPGLQVFSVDLRALNTATTYRLTLRHHVTAQNCNRPVQANLRRILPNLGEQLQDLSLAAQDCSRIGEILELKNIVPDLKLAAN